MAWNKEAIFATPEDAIKAIEKEGSIVRSKEEEKTFLANATSKAVDDAVKDHTKTLLDGWDKDIAEASGVKRDSATKTGDYIKKVITDFKKAVADITKERDEIKDKQMSKVEAVDEIKLQFDTFKKQAKTDLEAKDKEISTMKGAQFDNSIQAQVTEAMSRLRPQLAAIKNQAGEDDASMLEMMIEAKLSNFMKENKAVAHEGGIIYHNAADNTPVIDKEGNHLSTFSILESSFDSLIDKKHKAAGAGGATRKPGQAPTGENEFKIEVPGTVQNKQQLMDHVLGSSYKGVKLDQANPDHAQVIDKIYKANGGGDGESALPMR